MACVLQLGDELDDAPDDLARDVLEALRNQHVGQALLDAGRVGANARDRLVRCHSAERRNRRTNVLDQWQRRLDGRQARVGRRLRQLDDPIEPVLRVGQLALREARQLRLELRSAQRLPEIRCDARQIRVQALLVQPENRPDSFELGCAPILGSRG